MSTLEKAMQIISPWAQNPRTIEPHLMDAEIAPEALLDAVGALREIHWGYLSAITGIDLGIEANQLEVLYHFASGADVLALRVKIPRDAAAVDSVCGLIPSARLYEMELSEMFGVNVVGLNAQGYLFLADDWPQDIHPLRKDAPLAEGE